MRASPLFSTVGVLAGLGLLAWPLREMTRSTVATAVPSPVAEAPVPPGVPGVLRLRLLSAADSVEISDERGTTLWKSGPLGAGEHEAAVRFPLAGSDLELLVKATWPRPEGETALFVTVLPDHREDRTAYAIGAGRIEAPLEFHW